MLVVLCTASDPFLLQFFFMERKESEAHDITHLPSLTCTTSGMQGACCNDFQDDMSF